MNYLRALTFSMIDRLSPVIDSREMKPIWSPENETSHKALIFDELKTIDPKPLSARGGVDIHLVKPTDMNISTPLFLELGRLREKVFRSVGEGSGKEMDLDRNDPVYNHFIAVDSKSQTLLGSYRMGRLDELKAQGRAGYNEEFFQYSPALSEMLGRQGLEFGRSFVDKSAGKKALVAFFGLWNRIGLFLADSPHYRYLVGPVSISNSYSLTAKKVMVAYLRRYHMHPESLAKAKVPFESQLSEYERILVDNIKDIDQLNQTVQALDGQDIPPLLGIYSNLRGRYLDFAFDPDFNTVDGMIVVDMHDMNKNPALQAEYAKYMTEKGVEQYRRANGLE